MAKIGFQEIVILGIFFVAMSLAVDPVYAATGASQGGGSGLPWEMYILKAVQSLTGPVAYGIVVLMFLGAGIKWYQAGEFGSFGITFLSLGCAGALVVAAAQFVSVMYSGAVI